MVIDLARARRRIGCGCWALCLTSIAADFESQNHRLFHCLQHAGQKNRPGAAQNDSQFAEWPHEQVILASIWIIDLRPPRAP